VFLGEPLRSLHRFAILATSGRAIRSITFGLHFAQSHCRTMVRLGAPRAHLPFGGSATIPLATPRASLAGIGSFAASSIKYASIKYLRLTTNANNGFKFMYFFNVF
jgi:hypothetical protein